MKLLSKPRLSLTTFLVALTCLPFMASAQKNLDVCRLTTDMRSVKEGYGTGIYEVGKFSVDDFDGTKHNYRYETDGRVYIVDVDVEYGDSKAVEKGKPSQIILSLLVKLLNDTTSDSMAIPVEAGSKYRHKWGTVYISANVVVGDAAQHFRFTCSDGLSKDGVQRGEPKSLKRLPKHK